MITGKINALKIDKAKLFKGKNGTYLDIILIETPNNQYGDDYVIVQSVTKEDRLAGVKGAILGNAKILGKKPTSAPAASRPQSQESNDFPEVPF